MIPISDSVKSKGFQLFTVLIIAVNIFVFFLEITAPDSEAFIQTYSLIPQLVNFHNLNTLFPFVTSMFLHGGFLHIASNMLFLWVFGNSVEGYLRVLGYLFIYFLSGIIGNLTQYALMPGSNVPMLGASAAIAGVLGSYFILFPYSKIKTLFPFFGFVTVVNISAPFMLGYWFILQLISGTFSLIAPSGGGVAFFAHIGGFATGLIIMILLKPFVKYE